LRGRVVPGHPPTAPSPSQGAGGDDERDPYALSSRNRARARMATSTERKTVAWYCDRLGAARPAGLQSAHTVRPQVTTLPTRLQRSSESLMKSPSVAPSPGNGNRG